MIELTLPYPISANRYWATRVVKTKETGKPLAVTYVTPEAKAYRHQVETIAKQAGVRRAIAGRFALQLFLFPHRPLDWQRRERRDPLCWSDTVQCIDLDNANKVVLDALKPIVIVDDEWLRDLRSVRMEPDGSPSRVVVRVIELQIDNPQPSLELVGGEIYEPLPF